MLPDSEPFTDPTSPEDDSNLFSWKDAIGDAFTAEEEAIQKEKDAILIDAQARLARMINMYREALEAEGFDGRLLERLVTGYQKFLFQNAIISIVLGAGGSPDASNL